LKFCGRRLDFIQFLVNAIFCPSGDQTGLTSFAALRVSWRRLLLSALMTSMSHWSLRSS